MSKKSDMISGEFGIIPKKRSGPISKVGIKEHGKIIWWGNRRKGGGERRGECGEVRREEKNLVLPTCLRSVSSTQA